MRAGERPFQRLVEENADGMALLNEMHEIGYANPALARILGYGPDDLNGADFLQLVQEDDKPRVLSFLDDPEKKQDALLMRGRHKSGRHVWLEMRASRSSDHGKEAGIICSIRDVTGRARAEELLRESEQQAREKNSRLENAVEELRKTRSQVVREERLKAMGIMASGIVHDFSNALIPVLGIAELLLNYPERIANKNQITKDIQIIHSAARDAASVVNRLREFYGSRESSGADAPIDLCTIVKEAVEFTRPRWEAQAQETGLLFSFQLGLEPVPLIMGNAAELREALVNLILNALDAMHGGGTVEICTYAEGSKVFVEVQDGGIGISPEVEERLFEPFFTTKGKKGTGLGLSSVLGIVQRHGGSVWAGNRSGGGSVFTLAFPRSPGKEAGRAPSKSAPPKPERLHILLVEDNPAVQEVVAEYLTLDGHQVETAKDGLEGFEKFSPERFDLVITDWGMPNMNGGQLAAALKKAAPSLPIILLSGFGEALQGGEERPGGADLVMAKPITIAALREGIQKVLGRGGGVD